MWESRDYVKFVTCGDRGKQRQLRLRCCTFVPEVEVPIRNHDLCLMYLTNGRIWEDYLNNADCSAWETFTPPPNVKAFAGYVRDYNAERNIFLVADAIFQESVGQIHMSVLYSCGIRPIHSIVCQYCYHEMLP